MGRGEHFGQLLRIARELTREPNFTARVKLGLYWKILLQAAKEAVADIHDQLTKTFSIQVNPTLADPRQKAL